MLKIRLTRRGKKNSAFFRVVVAEHTSPIKGKFLENLGFFNPHTKEKEFKADRIKYWIEKGAQCSDTVHNLLVSNGVVSGPKRAVKIKQKPQPKTDQSLAGDEKTAENKTAPVETEKEKATAGEGEKKSEEAVEVKSEEKEVEKPAEAKEEKEEEKVEDTKPDPEKETEKKESVKEKK